MAFSLPDRMYCHENDNSKKNLKNLDLWQEETLPGDLAGAGGGGERGTHVVVVAAHKVGMRRRRKNVRD